MKRFSHIIMIAALVFFTAQAAYAAEGWQTGFNLPGVNGTVYALVFDSSTSSLYVGGDFTDAGGVPNTKYIAKWDGTTWSALKTGMNKAVRALALDSQGNLYAGGDFTSADGVLNTNYIAKWSSSSWTALKTGMNGAVHALVFSGTTLYVGGKFTGANGTTNTAYIAKWSASSWSALGRGMDKAVYALALDASNSLYAGGDFNYAMNSTSSVSAMNIAKWNGSWSAVDIGMSGPVYALAFYGGNIYAGGQFDRVGSGMLYAYNIAKWNGSSWSILGGVSGGEYSRPYYGSLVYAIVPDASGNLYVGGNFDSSGTGSAKTNYIAKLSGTTWSLLGTGMSHPVRALALNGSTLYAGGTFATAGGKPASNIAKYSSSTWTALGNGSGIVGQVRAIAVSGSTLYAGGTFNGAGKVAANYIAKFSGSSWSALKSGIQVSDSSSDGVDALAVYGNNLYVGGSFTSADSMSYTKNIAK